VVPLRVAFVIPAPDVVHREDPEAECLLRAWQADADVEASAVRVSDIRLAGWPLVLRTMSRADVIHVFPNTSSSVFGHTLPALAVARLLGRPAILSHRDDQNPDRCGRSAMLRRVLNAAAKSVVPSSVMVDALDRAGILATMIPHAVELAQFPFRDRHAFRPRVLSVRFQARDNVAATIRAFAIVQRRWPAAT
jgi:hypothetical protein